MTRGRTGGGAGARRPGGRKPVRGGGREQQAERVPRQPAAVGPSGFHLGGRLDLEITGLAQSGEGVGHAKGVAFFVPGTCPGDEAVVEVSEVRPDFLHARLLELKRPSPDRVRPACPVFGTCGGCQIQHIAYPRQLELKTGIVREALTRIGKLADPPVRPMLGMAEPWSYRNKAQFPVAQHGGRIVTGFYALGSHRVVPVESCPVQHGTNNQIIAEARKVAAKYELVPYDERRGEGFLRHVLCRVASETGQAMVAFVTNTRAFPHEVEIAREMTNRVPALSSVVQNVNAARTNVILGQVTRVLLGEPTIEDRLAGLRFRSAAESFVQTNPAQARAVYDKVLEYAALSAADDAVDAYCGVGTISLLLARKARTVRGIEKVEAAVNDARANAKLNRAGNVEFLLGEAEKVLPDLTRRGVKVAALVLDPPRKGVDHEVVQAALAMAPARIVYVSCDPATMARDAAKLISGGYELSEVWPVDMFPHTGHVECVALLRLKEPA